MDLVVEAVKHMQEEQEQLALFKEILGVQVLILVVTIFMEVVEVLVGQERLVYMEILRIKVWMEVAH